jgi:hypothetical protein
MDCTSTIYCPCRVTEYELDRQGLYISSVLVVAVEFL